MNQLLFVHLSASGRICLTSTVTHRTSPDRRRARRRLSIRFGAGQRYRARFSLCGKAWR
ncbi:hypothetical protein OG203_10780 [Nocardia sp. NBC_01499]|uniref:hypothetical protein n=1 Tax=Nocardia sp. NBC_01499 TaxID=2903597 RepID=UPI00386BD4E8